MEQILRVEVANIKNLEGWSAFLAGKMMRRFELVDTDCYRKVVFRELEKSFKRVEQATVYLDGSAKEPWAAYCATVFKSGTAEEMWAELERFAADFNRPTALVTHSCTGFTYYRYLDPNTGEKAYVYVQNGRILSDNPQAFLKKLPKSCGKKLPEDFGKGSFSDSASACRYAEKALGFISREEAWETYIKTLPRDAVCVRSFVYDPVMLSFSVKETFQEILNALMARPFLAGYRQSGNSLYRLFNNGAYMECLEFQRSMFNTAYDARFTVNVFCGAAKDCGLDRWRAADMKSSRLARFRTALRSPCLNLRIGGIAGKGDVWYDINPYADLQAVIGALLTDLEPTFSLFLEKRKAREANGSL